MATSNELWPMIDEYFDDIVACDVVEWPRLSQQVRLEKQHATTSLHVMDHDGNERGIFYALDVAAGFCDRYGFSHIEPRKILKETP